MSNKSKTKRSKRKKGSSSSSGEEIFNLSKVFRQGGPAEVQPIGKAEKVVVSDILNETHTVLFDEPITVFENIYIGSEVCHIANRRNGV